MLIANPIYDVVFKRLMENEKVAKFFIGTILNAHIEQLEVRPQEFTYIKDAAVEENVTSIGVTVFRLDFIALVRMADGTAHKILIEIQKASKEFDLMRFRNYLGEQYKKRDIVNEKKEVLPIKTIYILGFKLPTIESACLHIERQYRDMLTQRIIQKRSRFIESLTHDSYIVQVERIGGKYQTKLEKLLSIFEQAHFIDENSILKDYPHDIEEEEMKWITDILHHSGVDPKTRKEIEIEQEAWRTINALIGDKAEELYQTIKQKEEELEQKDQELEQKGQELEQKGQELEQKDQELEQKGQELEQKDQELEKQRQEIEALKRKLKGE